MRFLRALVYVICAAFCLVGLGKVSSDSGAVALLVAALGLCLAAMAQFFQGVLNVSSKREMQTKKLHDGTVGNGEHAQSKPQKVLGDKLQWEQGSDSCAVRGMGRTSFADAWGWRSEEKRDYQVIPEPGFFSPVYRVALYKTISVPQYRKISTSCRGETDDAPQCYNTLDTAIAACERHHTTGDWV